MHDYGDLRIQLLNNVVNINICTNFLRFVITSKFWCSFQLIDQHFFKNSKTCH